MFAQAVAREMLASGRGGVIINMSSESGMESEGQSVYAATKAANQNDPFLGQNLEKEAVVGVAPESWDHKHEKRCIRAVFGLYPWGFRG